MIKVDSAPIDRYPRGIVSQRLTPRFDGCVEALDHSLYPTELDNPSISSTPPVVAPT